MGPVWDIALAVFSVAGSGLTTYGVVSYKLGKKDGSEVEQIKTLTLAMARMDKEQEKAANRDLRIFQAIEQLRRLHKTGNGGVNWTDLIGE